MDPILLNILRVAVFGAISTTISIMAYSVWEKKSVFAPVNAISHILFGDIALVQKNFQPKYFFVGLILNFSAMLGWAALAEWADHIYKVTSTQLLLSMLVAFGITILAYVTDFYIVPKRFTPGFEHIITKKSLYMVYLFLAFGLLAGGLVRD